MSEFTDCIIAGAAPTDTDIFPTGNELIIAADGGADLLRENVIIPHIVIGGMDSVSGGSSGPGTEVIEFPTEKDDTDTLLAVKAGIDRGCRRFFIYGCSGGRLDHTIANIQTLKYLAASGCEGYLIGDSENITVIKDASISLNVSPGTVISVFAAGGTAEGVSLRGFKYCLDDAEVTASYPIGVSNEAEEERPLIKVSDGYLLIIWNGPFAVPQIRRPDGED